MRELCDWKGKHIVEAEVCPDYIHMLVEIPPKESVSVFYGLSQREKEYYHTRKARRSKI